MGCGLYEPLPRSCPEILFLKVLEAFCMEGAFIDVSEEASEETRRPRGPRGPRTGGALYSARRDMNVRARSFTA